MFNALCTSSHAEAANFPFCTIEPNVGSAVLRDARLLHVSNLAQSARCVFPSVDLVDIAGLVRGASSGAGLGNAFLSHVRECDALVHVVRCFADEGVAHVEGGPNARRDAEIIDTELALADLAQVERLRARRQARKAAAAGSPAQAARARMEADGLARVEEVLAAGRPARAAGLEPEAVAALRALGLLTLKPVTFAANVGEEELAGGGRDSAHVRELRDYARAQGAEVVAVSAQVEAELRALEPEEAKEYLKELGLRPEELGTLLHSVYRQLGLQTFYTAGEEKRKEKRGKRSPCFESDRSLQPSHARAAGKQEARAWTVPRGATAPQAAGVIHSDFERQFIRAETVALADFLAAGGWAGARSAGLARAEGKDYVMVDGDVCNFRTGA